MRNGDTIYYKGPIWLKWVTSYKFIDYKIVLEYGEEIIQREAYFYKNNADKIITLETDIALPEDREVDDFIDNIVNNYFALLYKNYYDNTIPEETKNNFLDNLKINTCVLFFNPHDLKPITNDDIDNINKLTSSKKIKRK